MLTLRFWLDGELYELRYPASHTRSNDVELSGFSVETLVRALWHNRDHRTIGELLHLLGDDRLAPIDADIVARLAARCRTLPGLSIVRSPWRRPPIHHDFAPTDLADLQDEPAPPVSTVHFFECILEDREGRPLPGIKCRLEHPDGTTEIVRSDGFGLIRLDDLPRPGEYAVTVLRPPDDVEDDDPSSSDAEDWFECILRSSDGVAIANQACEVITPDGVAHSCESDDEGRVRLEALGIVGDCELRFIA